ncbi:MAG TPA: hypothetical protein VN771_04515 [Candidatus Baltobacteraceae bacterium]|nr:hypothetical protein [Candidatus Baltobacteraceae bacterium]
MAFIQTVRGPVAPGEVGFTLPHLQATFLPRLLAAGVDAATLQTITVDNPRRLLTLPGTP